MTDFTIGWFERAVGFALFATLSAIVMVTGHAVVIEHGTASSDFTFAMQWAFRLVLAAGAVGFFGRPVSTLLVGKVRNRWGGADA